LEISRGGRLQTTLVPAQHYHKLQKTWTTEVAIHSTWSGDFYTILHSETPEGELSLTFVENPLMRWLWMGGAIMVLGTCLRLWPAGRRSARPADAPPAEKKQESDPAVPRRVVPPPLSRQRERRVRAAAETMRVPVGGRRPRVKPVDEENSTNRGEP
jgi:hypothetical protein